MPRALDLALRVTRLMTGVVSTLRVNKERMAAELTKGFSQATDLAEFVVQRCHLDYRAAYVVVGETVRTASRQGLRGIDITGEMLDQAALEHRGQTLGLTGADLTSVLDPKQIVMTRTSEGGAARAAVQAMIGSCRDQVADLRTTVERWRSSVERAEAKLLADAAAAAGTSGTSATRPGARP